MSTRAVVRIKETYKNRVYKVDLYHHYDGYIEGLGFELVETFLRDNKIYIPNDIDRVATELVKKDGFEVTVYSHADIEYFYEIDVTQGLLKAYEVNNWSDRMKKLKKYSMEELLNMYLTKNE